MSGGLASGRGSSLGLEFLEAVAVHLLLAENYNRTTTDNTTRVAERTETSRLRCFLAVSGLDDPGGLWASLARAADRERCILASGPRLALQGAPPVAGPPGHHRSLAGDGSI